MTADTLYFADLAASTPYRDSSGRVLAGAVLTFWKSGTTTPAPVYTTASRTTAHTAPITADSDGVFASIYLNPDVTYRVKLETADGVLLWDVDPYVTGQEGDIDVTAFLESGDFEVPAGVTSLHRLLVVAGGGGVGTSSGNGGGGGGGVILEEDYPVTPGATISVVVGVGGAAGGKGGDSKFGDLTAEGGGLGSSGDGGSGGGGGGGTNTPGSGTDGQGNDGGEGAEPDGAATRAGGGGGGAGEAGADAEAPNGGDGGDGLDCSDVFGDYGDDGWFGGGGGGGGASLGPGVGGEGGKGGGRDGGAGTDLPSGNTGGGGGGPGPGGGLTNRQVGDSGVVLIAIRLAAPFVCPVYQPVASGVPRSGAQLKFFVSDAIAKTYADYALTVPLSHPVIANAGGSFPPIYLEDKTYAAQLKNAAGTVISGPDDNPRPTIASIDPSTTPAEGDAFTLAVTGTGFVTGKSVVRWKGSDRVTTFVSSTEVTASILATDIEDEGGAAVTVFNPEPIGGASNAVKFTITEAENPVPTLSALDPEEATEGGDGFTLTVTGTGFVEDSVVRWGGSDRVTTYVDDTELTAAILEADIASDGEVSVTVFNPTPGGGESDPLTFTIEDEAPTDPDFDDVVALLHFDGEDESTTFTDVTGKTWTAAGDAQLDTAQKKFGTASLSLDGTGDYISAESAADFGFGDGDYTLECWARASNVTTRVNGLLDTRTAANTGVQFFFGGGQFTVPASRIGCSSNTGILATGGTVSANTWHHVAIAREGTTIRGFVDGALAFSVTDSRTYAAASTCFVGADYAGTAAQRFGGHIDDVRITKGLARYTEAFTPPAAPFPDQGPA